MQIKCGLSVFSCRCIKTEVCKFHLSNKLLVVYITLSYIHNTVGEKWKNRVYDMSGCMITSTFLIFFLATSRPLLCWKKFQKSRTQNLKTFYEKIRKNVVSSKLLLMRYVNKLLHTNTIILPPGSYQHMYLFTVPR